MPGAIDCSLSGTARKEREKENASPSRKSFTPLQLRGRGGTGGKVKCKGNHECRLLLPWRLMLFQLTMITCCQGSFCDYYLYQRCSYLIFRCPHNLQT